jgi:hypothetical protein
MNRSIALIACCSQKSDEPALAKDLYQSPLFKKSRQYAENNADQYFIMSALLGIVEPDKLIAPYECSMYDRNARGRRIWAHWIASQLRGVIHDGDFLIILAGRMYRDELIKILKRRYPNLDIDIPLEGLCIGQQLQTLTKENL